MAFQPYNERGFNKFGMPRGQGQQRGMSPFLDQPEDEEQQPDMANQIDQALGGAPKQFSKQPPAMGRQFGAQPVNNTQPVGNRFKFDQPQGMPPGFAAGAEAQKQPTPQPPVASKMPQGGMWGSNYEWEGEGGPGDLQFGDVSRLTGFNTNAWGSGERGSNSFKNTFGKIASRYEAKPSSMQAIFNDPDFKKFFPNAKIVDATTTDKIDFGDGNPIDVLRAADMASDSSTGWAFQDESGAGQQMAQAPGLAGVDQGLGQDQIMAALMGDGQGLESQISIEQILAALQAQEQPQDDPYGDLLRQFQI